MARSNKYASINFNDIYEKKSNLKPNTKSISPSSSSTPLSSSHKTHGGMLVLTRPQPKPLPQIQPIPSPKPSLPIQSEPDPDPISLRPLGRTGASLPSPSPSAEPTPTPTPTPTLPPPTKSEAFVPPHLRPGFVGKEEKFAQQRSQSFQSRHLGQAQNGQVGSPGRYGEDGRPKSGGYERIRRGVAEMDLGEMNRPGSGGGWNGSSSSNRSPRF